MRPAVLVALLLSACAQKAPPPQIFQPGERVQVARVIYTVTDTKWLTQIGAGPDSKKPSNHYAVIHLTAVNSGGSDAYIPTLHLEAADGRTIPEVSDAPGLDNWIGVVRRIKPADSMEGTVAFDVPPGKYRLRIAEDAESPQVAFVALPLRFEEGPPLVPSINDADAAQRLQAR
jgi:hypothetical protein